MALAPPSTDERAFAFVRVNERPPKPRTRGVTEIRGPLLNEEATHELA
jgi:hypothetical protein